MVTGAVMGAREKMRVAEGRVPVDGIETSGIDAETEGDVVGSALRVEGVGGVVAAEDPGWWTADSDVSGAQSARHVAMVNVQERRDSVLQDNASARVFVDVDAPDGESWAGRCGSGQRVPQVGKAKRQGAGYVK